MVQYNIENMEASDLTNTIENFSVDPQGTDGATEQEETTWIDTNFKDYLGYYKSEKTPEITAVIDAKSTWTIGKGLKADEETLMLLDTIKGFGKDTFNTILEVSINI